MQPLPVWYLRNRTFLDISQQARSKQLLAHLGPPAMSAFLPLLGDKRTSNAPSPGVPIYEYTTPKGVYYDDADRYPLSPHKRRKSGHFLTAVREDRRRPTGQQRRRRWR